jgi:hypothetical protein
MNRDNSKQVDLLLRALAKNSRQRAEPYVAGVSDDHLDADELNAYAEGQLPEPARLRYNEHLADCQSCRGIVVQLQQAAGVVVTTAASELQTDRGFWSSVLAFFSPPVLRYALPALALAGVIAVSLFALRQRQDSEYVAQHQPETNPSIQNSASPRPGQATPSDIQTGPSDTPHGEVARESAKTVDDRFGQSTATSTDLGTAGPLKDSEKRAELKPGQSETGFAPEPQTVPPPPPPRVAEEQLDKAAAMNKQATTERDAGQRRSEDRSQPAQEAESNRAAAPKAAPMTARRVEGLMAERGQYGLKTKKDDADETETKTVGGRQFRRQGNVWIDVAYNSSRSTTNVVRGSEQYRALIADEPGIGDIANRLSGEVIIVWKGRAYRIR